jgi:hypothetical protein
VAKIAEQFWSPSHFSPNTQVLQDCNKCFPGADSGINDANLGLWISQFLASCFEKAYRLPGPAPHDVPIGFVSTRKH